MTWEIPVGGSTADRFARELALLLGPAHGNAAKDSHRADDLAALGAVIAYAWQRQRDSVAEVHPPTAAELLAELEGEFGLPTDEGLPLDQRQAALTAKARARFEGTPDALTYSASTLATLTVHEILARRVAHTDTTAVWRLVFVLRTSDYAELDRIGYTRGKLYGLLRQQVPAYTAVTFAAHVGFFCDDPDSLTDRDALGT